MSNILTNNINPRSGNKITIGGVNDTVSIAGTVTYEDVTSVDSIGIITARNGINVPGGNVTISADLTVDTDTLYVDSSNNRIGVGTTTPGGKLVVSDGSTTFQFDPVGGTGNILRSLTSAGARDALLFDATQYVYTNSATEYARIDTSGRLLVGTSTPNGNNRLQILGNASSSTGAGAISLRRGSSLAGTGAGIQLGIVDFTFTDGGVGASIYGASDGTAGTNDYPGRLVFSTTADGASSPTERMRISSSGELFLNTTQVNPGFGGDTNSGVYFGAANYLMLARNGNPSLYVNRNTNDGVLVAFNQAGTEEGTISVSGPTVSYNQFLGSHWAALIDWSRPEIKIGTILEIINELTDWKLATIEVDGEQKKICYNGTAVPGDTVSVEYEGKTYEGIVKLETNPEFNKAVKVKVNDTAASKAVYGVFVGWNTDKNFDGGIWNDMYVGAVGNYVIRMAADQKPEIGDLVEADGTGCAVVQDDDIIRTKTVAKITSTIPQVTYDDGSFLVTCVLYCG